MKFDGFNQLFTQMACDGSSAEKQIANRARQDGRRGAWTPARLAFGVHDETRGWLAPETIVRPIFDEEDPIGRLARKSLPPRPALAPAMSLAISTLTTVVTAAILLTLIV